MTWLDLQFGQHEHLRRLVEGEAYELLVLAREFGQEQAVLTGPGDLLTRVERLHTRAQDLSAGWSTGFHATETGIGISFTERYPGAGAEEPVPLGGLFAFPAGDPAADAIRRQLDDVLDYGGEVVVDRRYLTAGQATAVQIASTTGPLGTLPTYQLVLATTGGAVRHRLTLHADAPTIGRRGARTVMRDPTGTFTAVLTADRPELGGMVNISLTTRGLAGRYPYEVRDALDLFSAAEPADQLQLRVNNRPIGTPRGLDQTGLATLLLEARDNAGLIAALERLQHHTGQSFPIPDDLTQADAVDLLDADRLLAGHEIRIQQDQITLTVRADRLEAFLDMVPSLDPLGGMRIENVFYSVTCGPHAITLDPITLRAPRLELANLDALRVAVGTGVDPVARYVCVDGEGIYATLAR
ncbi:hypothetical protein ACFFX1_10850 [Dactylosporangium sucinum]|uniref:Uncharacterized protein n=1 Tax=Dactylosporangium sucinum TaxID=1424081 RepID=A0A917TJB1_9ACTN|nr:hypothetical protein [Dactylosporangium sucinum]GGM22892.1 hypothetical protein GCM10007977_025100 [Dactylosporangium sucinum]